MKIKVTIEMEVDTELYDDVSTKSDAIELIRDAMIHMADWPDKYVVKTEHETFTVS